MSKYSLWAHAGVGSEENNRRVVVAPTPASTTVMPSADGAAGGIGPDPLAAERHRTATLWRNGPVSARMRILRWSVGFLAAALLATTAGVHVILLRRADAVVRQDLAHEVVEFRSERTSEPASSSRQVAARLVDATRRSVPKSDIVLIGLLNGRVFSVSEGLTVRALTRSAAQWRRLAAVSRQTGGTLALPAGSARFTALPVRAPGDPARGVFVAAVLLGPEHALAWQVTRVQLEVGSASLLLASLLAWWMAGRVLRPIRATTDLARRITDSRLDERLPVRGHDEVSAMADTFNAMLDRLQGAFAAQRQFLADAGHELRTPITIVQGNLDTLATSDPDDAETLALVADELSRMTRLVNELSLLAASEQPDFVRPARADLGELAAQLAAKVDALSDRPWTVRSTISGVALVDTQRITQAILQLAANAIAHTSPETRLSLNFRAVGNDLEFSVVDRGPGVSPEHRSRVFERFLQLDNKHDHSTGLGLSIVAAIASAHGGSVFLTDTAGGGATFTLRVPLIRTPEAPGLKTFRGTEAS